MNEGDAVELLTKDKIDIFISYEAPIFSHRVLKYALDKLDKSSRIKINLIPNSARNFTDYAEL
jgi:hypothetical protein